MEVILIENIEKLGKVGDVVKVKDGYARNYLIPKKKVLRANKENLKAVVLLNQLFYLKFQNYYKLK